MGRQLTTEGNLVVGRTSQLNYWTRLTTAPNVRHNLFKMIQGTVNQYRDLKYDLSTMRKPLISDVRCGSKWNIFTTTTTTTTSTVKISASRMLHMTAACCVIWALMLW